MACCNKRNKVHCFSISLFSAPPRKKRRSKGEEKRQRIRDVIGYFHRKENPLAHFNKCTATYFRTYFKTSACPTYRGDERYFHPCRPRGPDSTRNRRHGEDYHILFTSFKEWSDTMSFSHRTSNITYTSGYVVLNVKH